MVIAWHILAVIFIIVAAYFGLIYSLLGVTGLIGKRTRETARRWFYLVVGLALFTSAGIILTLLIDPASLTLATIATAPLGLAVGIGPLLLLAIAGGRLPREGRGWRILEALSRPPIRLATRLLLVALPAVAASTTHDPQARILDLALAAMLLTLMLWELWLHWHYRARA